MLIATAQPADRGLNGVQTNIQFLHEFLGQLAFFGLIQPESLHGGQLGQGHVFVDSHWHKETQDFSVFRHHSQPGSDGLAGGLEAHRAVVELDCAAVEIVRPKNGPHHFAAPGPNQPGEAQDFALAQGEADIAEGFTGQLVNFQQLGPNVFGHAANAAVKLPPDHHVDHGLFGCLRPVDGAHISPVTENRNAVGDVQHLVNFVGNIDDGDAPGLERFDDLEEALGFRIGQGRIGFIHDDELGIGGDGPGDFDHLALRDGQIPHERIRVHIQIDQGHGGPGSLFQGLPLDPAAPTEVAHEHILHHSEGGHHG